jgi:hypothetical protein
MKTRKFLPLVISVVILFTACDNPLKTPVETAANSLEKGTQNLKDGMTALGALDPAGLKKLMDENKVLRDQIAEFNQKAMASIAGAGVVDIQKRRVLLNITNYTGSFRIVSYLDTKENILWNVRVDDKKIPSLFEDMAAKIRASYMGACGAHDYNTWMTCIGKTAKDYADEKFNLFLENSVLIPGPRLKPIELNSRIGSDGVHTLFIEIIPIAYDIGKRWSITTQLFLVPANGADAEDILQIDLDSDIPVYKDHVLGTPLPSNLTRQAPTISIPLIIKK